MCWILASLLTAVLAIPMPVLAVQARATGGDIKGHVADASGARLPSAAVTARNRATNIVRDAVADSDGRFVLAALEPGEYDVRAEHPGFSPAGRERFGSRSATSSR